MFCARQYSAKVGVPHRGPGAWTLPGLFSPSRRLAERVALAWLDCPVAALLAARHTGQQGRYGQSRQAHAETRFVRGARELDRLGRSDVAVAVPVNLGQLPDTRGRQ